MARLKYVGRNPDRDYTVAHTGFVDSHHDSIAVTEEYVAQRAGLVSAGMVSESYVDARDALRAKKTAVETADNNFVLVSSLGAANGVAKIGTDGFLPSGQLPTVATDRTPVIVDSPTKYLTTKTVSSTDIREYRAAKLDISDPGWPYWPVVFATVRGKSTASADRLRRAGSGPYGRIAIIDDHDDVWGGCVCAATPRYNFYEAVPHSGAKSKPSDTAPCEGARELSMYLSLYSGDSLGFTFNDTGFKFFAIVFPAVEA